MMMVTSQEREMYFEILGTCVSSSLVIVMIWTWEAVIPEPIMTRVCTTGIHSRRGMIFVFATAFTPALGPSQPKILESKAAEA